MTFISEFLITIFESLNLYSVQGGLAEHLRGMNLEGEAFSRQSIYNMVFLALFLINSIIIVNYYYGLFNRIPFNRTIWWIINVFFGALIMFLIAFLYSNNDFESGNFYPDLNITTSDCVGFGITTSIFSLLWSTLLSVLIKWNSSVNKKVPF
jgi:hypothetical protein